MSYGQEGPYRVQECGKEKEERHCDDEKEKERKKERKKEDQNNQE